MHISNWCAFINMWIAGSKRWKNKFGATADMPKRRADFCNHTGRPWGNFMKFWQEYRKTCLSKKMNSEIVWHSPLVIDIYTRKLCACIEKLMD